ncbi:hypothetical protein [Bradymonas sediminis]|uniref:Uncharacterized protein n=1 Tax=Bradymonas sediminis TaxID=1548548 RepID=A0A2Z4FIA2_9DELT|nr:hypothetical protein [Bradymonas sediminis]AWV88454.1 hypothetical protein DN745_03465 [Bradymonas sediminis]TDP77585.1 hypothetical protein DFR33_101488 [Bradymonas sediminis]
MRKKSHLFIYLFAALAIGLSGCGDDGDSTNNDNGGSSASNNSGNGGDRPSDSSMGSVTLNLSGEVSASRAGFADFSEMDFGPTQTWELSMNDISPQTFSLTLMAISDTATRPSPGEYIIGAASNDPGQFQAVYTHIEDGDFVNAVEYTSQRSGGGVLKIETSTDAKVSGTFEFTADRYAEPMDATPAGTIQVTGSFEATPRQSL